MRMTSKTMSILAIVSILLIAGINCISSYIKYNNTDVELRNKATAQLKVIESKHNSMRRTLSQIAETAKLSVDKQESIYQGMIEGRYKAGDGSLMKMITEDNPRVDMSILTKLVNTIETENASFDHEQKVMSSIIQEHSNLIKKFPGSLFISNKSEIQYTTISSKYTKKVMETGEDEEIKLF